MTRIAVALLGVLIAIGGGQHANSNAAAWRTSLPAFLKAISEFPTADLPVATSIGSDVGQRVGASQAIMKRFGGTVEFAATFDGVLTGEFLLSPERKRQKIDVSIDWPTDTNTYWRLHLYPKASALKAWRALRPKTPVTFRAVVTGIAWFPTWIPASNVIGIVILLEDGEVVSKP